MDKKKSNELLDENGKIAADLLVKILNQNEGIQVIQNSIKINDLWAVVFDVRLPNGAGSIEFTAMQTGWSGDAFADLTVC